MIRQATSWLIGALCILGTVDVSAEPQEIKRFTNSDGVTVFTDLPPADANSVETILIDPTPSFNLPSPTYLPSTQAIQPRKKKRGPIYSQFEFTSPTHELTIRNNEVNVPYRININPSLRGSHELVVTVNGESVSSDSTGNLTGLFRGAHVLQGKIIKRSNGKIIQSTKPITIYVHKVGLNQNRPAVSQ